MGLLDKIRAEGKRFDDRVRNDPVGTLGGVLIGGGILGGAAQAASTGGAAGAGAGAIQAIGQNAIPIAAADRARRGEFNFGGSSPNGSNIPAFQLPFIQQALESAGGLLNNTSPNAEQNAAFNALQQLGIPLGIQQQAGGQFANNNPFVRGLSGRALSNLQNLGVSDNLQRAEFAFNPFLNRGLEGSAISALQQNAPSIFDQLTRANAPFAGLQSAASQGLLGLNTNALQRQQNQGNPFASNALTQAATRGLLNLQTPGALSSLANGRFQNALTGPNFAVAANQLTNLDPGSGIRNTAAGGFLNSAPAAFNELTNLQAPQALRDIASSGAGVPDELLNLNADDLRNFDGSFEQVRGLLDTQTPGALQDIAAGGSLGARPQQFDELLNLRTPEALQSTARGDFLNANPFLERQFNRAADAVTERFNDVIRPGIDSRFAAAGRFGSGAQQHAQRRAEDALGSQLTDLATGIFGDNFARERQNQLSAAGQIGGLEQNRAGQIANFFGDQFARNQGNQLSALGQVAGLDQNRAAQLANAFQNAQGNRLSALGQTANFDLNRASQIANASGNAQQTQLNAALGLGDFEQNRANAIAQNFGNRFNQERAAQLQAQQFIPEFQRQNALSAANIFGDQLQRDRATQLQAASQLGGLQQNQAFNLANLISGNRNQLLDRNLAAAQALTGAQQNQAFGLADRVSNNIFNNRAGQLNAGNALANFNQNRAGQLSSFIGNQFNQNQANRLNASQFNAGLRNDIAQLQSGLLSSNLNNERARQFAAQQLIPQLQQQNALNVFNAANNRADLPLQRIGLGADIATRNLTGGQAPLQGGNRNAGILGGAIGGGTLGVQLGGPMGGLIGAGLGGLLGGDFF